MFARTEKTGRAGRQKKKKKKRKTKRCNGYGSYRCLFPLLPWVMGIHHHHHHHHRVSLIGGGLTVRNGNRRRSDNHGNQERKKKKTEGTTIAMRPVRPSFPFPSLVQPPPGQNIDYTTPTHRHKQRQRLAKPVRTPKRKKLYYQRFSPRYSLWRHASDQPPSQTRPSPGGDHTLQRREGSQ